MGAYINPPDRSKEQWLKEHAFELDYKPKKYDRHEGYLHVCLVDNGNFTAAGIAYSQQELEVFKNSNDDRPKKWFIAPTDKLLEVSNLQDYLYLEKIFQPTGSIPKKTLWDKLLGWIKKLLAS